LPGKNWQQMVDRADLLEQIGKNTDIYFRTGKGVLPRLYVNENSIVGVPRDENQMFSALTDLLARQ